MLKCRKCGYEYKKEKIPNRCPYCGESGTLEPQATAQDILDDVVYEEKVQK